MSRLPLYFLCGLAPLFIGGVVRAQDTAPPTIVSPTTDSPATEPEVALDELVRRVLENNPQLPAARANQDAARERLNVLRSRPNPVLQLVPGIGGTREARDEEVILAQPLDVFGQRRAQSGVAAAELRRAQAETTLAERTLVVQVKNAAADLFAAQEAESLGVAQVDVAQAFRNAAARRAQLGDVPPVQVQRADLELLRVQNDLTNAQTERLARRAALNQLIGQAPETPLRVALPLASGLTDLLRLRGPVTPNATQLGTTGNIPSVPPLVTPPTTAPSGTATPATGAPVVGSSAQVGSNLVGARGQILPNALSTRPDLLSAQATLEARQAQVEVLRRQGRPQLEVQGRRSAFFGRNGSYALRAVVTIPIFDYGSLKAERRAAQADVRAQEAQILVLRSQVSTQVEQALLRLEQQRQTVERYRAQPNGIVPLTLDLLRKTQIGYNAGASTYLEVLEAQRTLRQVQTEYLQALVGVRVSEAALESALGAAPPGSLTGNLENPSGAPTPPGVAAPGTVPGDVIPPNVVPNAAPGVNAPATGANSPAR